MKKVFFWTGFLLLFLLGSGCTKEEFTVFPAAGRSQKKVTAPSIQLIDCSEELVQSISPGDITKYPGTRLLPRTSSNSSANGEFTPMVGWTLSFSGMLNPSGYHGEASLTGPLASFVAETECMAFEGNEVVYGGIITEVLYHLDLFLFLEPGMHFAFKVKDNGEGHNAPPDEMSGILAFGPVPICPILPPSAPEWGEMQDFIGLTDQVQVKP